jgi:hypothetical protein
MKKIYLSVAGLVGAGALALGSFVGAQTPSATSTLDSIMGVIISTTVSLATTIFTTYWPYVLIFGVIAGLVGLFAKFVHLGGHGKK